MKQHLVSISMQQEPESKAKENNVRVSNYVGRFNGWASVFLKTVSNVTPKLEYWNNDNSQDIFVKTNDTRIAKKQIEVLERLRKPERLH